MNDQIWHHNGEEVKEPLHYPECGLDNIYLVSGYELEDTPHGEALSVKNEDGLIEAIAHHLVTEKKALSGEEYRFLRGQLDLTQAELAHLLGVSPQTVARWEKGDCDLTGPAEGMIRVLWSEQFKAGEPILELLHRLAEADDPGNRKTFFGNDDSNWHSQAA